MATRILGRISLIIMVTMEKIVFYGVLMDLCNKCILISGSFSRILLNYFK